MDPTTWLGVAYDCILLCVDRTSGWIIARPTTKLGLMGERLLISFSTHFGRDGGAVLDHIGPSSTIHVPMVAYDVLKVGGASSLSTS